VKRVAVVGGGLAGLTAAYRLAQRNYEVTLYESEPMLGGNVASRRGKDEAPYDVYPHMYLNWYHNFWQLLDDVGCAEREALFAPISKVSFLKEGAFPRVSSLTDTCSPWRGLQNLFSGVRPPADMYLFLYASLDLLATRADPSKLLGDFSVNGFLQSRPYMTERAADVFDFWITAVWAIPSYLTSAADYRSFLEHGYQQPTPALWLLRDAAEDAYVTPIANALLAEGGTIRRSTEVTRVTCEGGRVQEITWKSQGEESTEQVDQLVLAVPPIALSNLIRAGESGQRIVDAEPGLAPVVRLRSESIPIVHLYFTRKLDDIPREPVGLVGSPSKLAFTDVSQTAANVPAWKGITVLALSASDRAWLPGNERDDAMLMIRELGRYIPTFNPGEAWGKSPDIDWERTRIDYNDGTKLFVNEVGADVLRPRAGCAALPNLHLAGDYCRNPVGMTSVEAAVVTGLLAAQSVVERRGGARVEIVEPSTVPVALCAWFRYLWAPYAAYASMWSKGSDVAGGVLRVLRAGGSTLRHLLMPMQSRSHR